MVIVSALTEAFLPAHRAQVSAVLGKPFAMDDLVSAVQGAIAQG